METFVQRLAKKREVQQEITVLPVLNTRGHDHEAGCGCGEAGCSDGAEGGCCGG